MAGGCSAPGSLVEELRQDSPMDTNRELGKTILINGASSSGKSTIAQHLQQTIPIPFWHFSFDHLRDSNVLPMARIRSGEIDWSAMRPAVFDGFHRCLPVLAEAGNNLIVEHIIENEMWMSNLMKFLAGLDVFFVGVHCPLPELERRERERGNRRVGEAGTDYQAVHGFAEYDLEVDSMQPCQTNANKLVDAWKSRRTPSAFDRMAARNGIA